MCRWLCSLFFFVPFLAGDVLALENPKPNVVFILIDDMGWNDLGCYGSTFYETPNIDRLAGQGMRFTNAYAACPVCSPTRAGIMTGKYPARLHLTDWLPGRPDRPVAEAPAARVPSAASPGRSHARQGPQAAGLRHGEHRQVAPGRADRSGPNTRAST